MSSDIQIDMADIAGEYLFIIQLVGGTYLIDPLKYDDPFNEVNALDILKLQKHFPDLDELDDRFIELAAYVNRAGQNNTLD